MKTRRLSLFLTLLLTLGLLLALAAPAQAAEYELWVGGVQVTDDNKADVLGVADGDSATVVFDSAANTLTLTNAKLTAAYKVQVTKGDPPQANYINSVIMSRLPLELVLAGENSIIMPDGVPGEDSCGILLSQELIVSGSGSLTIQGGAGGVDSYGIYCSSLTIKAGPVLTVTSGSQVSDDSYGLYCRSLTLEKNAEFTVKGGPAADDSNGLYCSESLTVGYSATLTASGSQAGDDSYGIECGGAMILDSYAAVTASSGEAADHSFGMRIFAGSLTLGYGSDLIANAGPAGDSKGFGVEVAEGDLSIEIFAAITARGAGAALSIPQGTISIAEDYGTYILAGGSPETAEKYSGAITGLASPDYKYVLLEDYGYSIYVNGEQFGQDRLSIACGDGLAVYDPDKKTLTLTDTVMDQTYPARRYPDDTAASRIDVDAAILSLDDLELVLVGENIAIAPDQDPDRQSMAVLAGGQLTISGRGSLTARGGDKGLDSYGLYAQGLTIKGGPELTLIGGDQTVHDSFGIYCTKTLTLEPGARLIAGGGEAKENSYGVYCTEETPVLAGPADLTALGQTRALYNALDISSDKASLTLTNLDPYPDAAQPWDGLTPLGGADSPYKYIRLFPAGTGEVFQDVKAGQWFHAPVLNMYNQGLMQGVSSDRFDPHGLTWRNMLVTILWRLEGQPQVNYAMTFTDVAGDSWYEEAVRWSQSQELVQGYNAQTFGSQDVITREQLVTILYRYAMYKDYDVSAAADLSAYTDSGSVSGYAAPAMAWAVDEGLLQGSDGRLDPQGGAERCQVAAVLDRFIQRYMK